MEKSLRASAFGMRLSGMGFQRVKGAQGRRRWAGVNVVERAEEKQVAEVAEAARGSSWGGTRPQSQRFVGIPAAR